MLNIFFLSLSALAQENLIYNGSFEEYSSCPTSNNTYNGEFEKAIGWWSPSYFSTPDYFNACANGGVGSFDVGVPNNFWGYQYAYHGNGYANLSVECWDETGTRVAGEYIQTRVLEPLQPCSSYKISFYISLANYSSHNIQYINVGFTGDSTYYCNDLSSNCANIPAIDDYISIAIPTGKDTINWFKCEAGFSPSETANFITIGSFQINLSDAIYLQESLPGWYPNYYTTYYIDSILLEKVVNVEDCSSSIFVPNIFTPNNDGLNDYVDFTNFEKVEIISRWGSVVLIMDEQSNFEWHGKNFKNEDLPDGVYFYIAEKAGIQQTGSIQLIR